MTTGNRIRELRKKKGMSQTELAEKIGVSLNTMSKIESDKSDIPSESLKKVSEIFEVSADYLLSGKENSSELSDEEREILDFVRKDKDFSDTIKQAAKLKKKAINYFRAYKLPSHVAKATV